MESKIIDKDFFGEFLDRMPKDTDLLVISTWKGIDGITSHKEDFLKLFRQGVRVRFIVGGVFGQEGLIDLLESINQIFGERPWSEYLKSSNQFITFGCPNLNMDSARKNRQGPVHTKLWLSFQKNIVNFGALGSANFSTASLSRNVEHMCFIEDKAALEQCSKSLSELKPHTINPYSIKDFLDNPEHKKFVAKMRALKGKIDKLESGIKPRFDLKKSIIKKREPISPAPLSKIELVVSDNGKFRDFFYVMKGAKRKGGTSFIPPESLLKVAFEDSIIERYHNPAFRIKHQIDAEILSKDLSRKYKEQQAKKAVINSSLTISTSIGSCVKAADKAEFLESLEFMGEERDQLHKELLKYSKSDDFKNTISSNILDLLLTLHSDFKKDAKAEYQKMPEKEFAKAARKMVLANQKELMCLAEKVLNRSLYSLNKNIDVSLVPLHTIVDYIEGVSKADLAEELGVRI